MVDICRILEQASSTVAERAREEGRVLERISPSVLVKISGRDLADEFLADKISSVVVEETARGLSMATVKIGRVAAARPAGRFPRNPG